MPIHNAQPMLIGREWNVKLAYLVEYDLSVLSGPQEHQAIEEAELLAGPVGPTDPTDWELLNSKASATRDIFEDDPEAFRAADWIDGPSAPSEQTYWDDSEHFEDTTPEEHL